MRTAAHDRRRGSGGAGALGAPTTGAAGDDTSRGEDSFYLAARCRSPKGVGLLRDTSDARRLAQHHGQVYRESPVSGGALLGCS